jgi:hypothetical protein
MQARMGKAVAALSTRFLIHPQTGWVTFCHQDSTTLFPTTSFIACVKGIRQATCARATQQVHHSVLSKKHNAHHVTV